MDAYAFLFTKIQQRGEKMDKNVEQLVLVLTKEYEIYTEITQLAELKKKVIMDSKLKELEEITKKEQAFTLSLIKLENLRSKTVDQLLSLYNLVEVNNVSDLLQYMAEDERLAVSNMKSKILNEVQVIEQKNNQNRALLEQSLEFIDFNMDVLTTLDDSNEYGSDAGEKDRETRSIFDVKV